MKVITIISILLVSLTANAKFKGRNSFASKAAKYTNIIHQPSFDEFWVFPKELKNYPFFNFRKTNYTDTNHISAILLKKNEPHKKDQISFPYQTYLKLLELNLKFRNSVNDLVDSNAKFGVNIKTQPNISRFLDSHYIYKWEPLKSRNYFGLFKAYRKASWKQDYMVDIIQGDLLPYIRTNEFIVPFNLANKKLDVSENELNQMAKSLQKQVPSVISFMALSTLELRDKEHSKLNIPQPNHTFRLEDSYKLKALYYFCSQHFVFYTSLVYHGKTLDQFTDLTKEDLATHSFRYYNLVRETITALTDYNTYFTTREKREENRYKEFYHNGEIFGAIKLCLAATKSAAVFYNNLEIDLPTSFEELHLYMPNKATLHRKNGNNLSVNREDLNDALL